MPFDWLNLTATIAGIVGVLLAALALYVTRRQRIAAEREIAHERRVTFELEVLRDLLTSINYNAASDPRTRALLASLPAQDLPLMRLCQQAEDEGRDIQAALKAELDMRPTLFPHPNFDRRATLALADEIRQSMARRVDAPIQLRESVLRRLHGRWQARRNTARGR